MGVYVTVPSASGTGCFFNFTGLQKGEYRIVIAEPSSGPYEFPQGTFKDFTLIQSFDKQFLTIKYTGSCNPENPPAGKCTRTQGYWGNHGSGACAGGSASNPKLSAWPVNTLNLGNKTYNESELCGILKSSSEGGNVFTILATQLIAAKLNVANGAETVLNTPISGYENINAVIAAADAYMGNGVIIGSEAEALAIKDILDDYNNGKLTNAGHCQ
jgi:hypothetical protein